MLAREDRVARPCIADPLIRSRIDRTAVDLDEDVEQDEAEHERSREDGREDRALLPHLVREPVADAVATAVDVRDRRHEREPERRYDNAGKALVHMEQELLQVQQVPRRLRRVRRAVDGRVVLERRVEERRDDEQAERPNHRGDELDDQQVRPHHRRVLDPLVDAHDRVLADEGQEPEPLLLPRERLRSSAAHRRSDERLRGSLRAQGPLPLGPLSASKASVREEPRTRPPRTEQPQAAEGGA